MSQCKNDPQAACGQCEQPLLEQIHGLLEGVRKGERPDLKTVDSFIAALPESMRKTYLVMTDSRSIQKSSAKFPRILLKSPESEVYISFNTDPSAKGYDRVEMLFWNGKEAKFEMKEVQFPGESRTNSAKPAGAMPSVHDNPASCVECHRMPMRPNWDPYNFWAGLLGFNRDSLFKDTKEADLYIEFLKRVEDREPRLRNLIPWTSSTDLNTKLNSDSSVRIPHFPQTTQVGNPSDGPGVRAFDQLANKNYCRISNDLMKDPFYPYFKYALAGAFKRCPIEQFVPGNFRKRADSFFAKQGIRSLKELVDDTGKRQQSVFQDKLNRQIEYMTPILGSAEAANAEVMKNSPQDRETKFNADQIAAARFVLEPLGIPVSTWSMSNDPTTYSFADLLYQMTDSSAVKSVADEVPKDQLSNACSWYAEKSREAFSSPEFLKMAGIQPDNEPDPIPPSTNQNVSVAEPCNNSESLVPTGLPKVSAETILAIQRVEIQKILTSKRCIECHTETFDGPYIPFDSAIAFEDAVKSSYAKPGLTLADKILDRIQRDPSQAGKMPPVKSGQHLPPEDVGFIRSYLEYLKSQAPQPPSGNTGPKPFKNGPILEIIQ